MFTNPSVWMSAIALVIAFSSCIVVVSMSDKVERQFGEPVNISVSGKTESSTITSDNVKEFQSNWQKYCAELDRIYWEGVFEAGMSNEEIIALYAEESSFTTEEALKRLGWCQVGVKVPDK